ncbi:hypothetical protein [Ancylobacter sp.]|uniref:hypothetical protein n=1 Tax=Ancylobacter sp. TaxID=1872567 RepID=UPI003D09A90F
MFLVGTLINLALGGIALATHVNDAPIWLSAGIFFLPLPYNLMLCLSVWRSSNRQPSSWSVFAKCAAVSWVALMLVV